MALVPTEQDRATSDGFMGKLAQVLGLGGGEGAAYGAPVVAPVQVAQGPAYSSGLGAFAFGDAFSQGLNGARAQRAAEAQALAAAQQQQQLARAKAAYIANPNARTFNALNVLDPKNSEAIKRGFDAMDVDQQKTSLQEVSAIRGYLAAGRPQDAARRLEARIAADKAAGQDTADDETMLDLIRTSPKEAAAAVDYQLAAIMGPDKWSAAFKEIGDDQRADAKLEPEIAGIQAETGLKTAQAGKAEAEAQEVAPNAESERQYRTAATERWRAQTANEAARLDLDADRYAAEAAMKIDELEQKRSNPVPLSATSEKAMTDAVGAATAAQGLATRASTLAAGLKASDAAGGWMAVVSETGKNALGTQDAVSVIRRDIQSVLNSQALTLLPPGPASDKDIAIIKSGMPQPTWKKERVVEYLEALARTQARIGDVQQARADWISENGNIGKASRDLTINGRQVARGSNFSDFARSTETASTPAPAASAILDRYGR
jgi:hypothetical protein